MLEPCEDDVDGFRVSENGHIMITAPSLWHLGHASPWRSGIRYALVFSENGLLSQDACSLIYLGCRLETEGEPPHPHPPMIMDPNLT